MRKIIFAFICIFFLISMVSAEMKFYQDIQDRGNGTIRNSVIVQYKKEGLINPSHDYISAKNPLEVYFLYNAYLQSWNNENPNFKVNYCEFTIQYANALENFSTLMVNLTFTPDSADVLNAKYFVRIDDKETIFARQTCYFQNRSYDGLAMPMEMQLMTPSWECKACQFYEWSVIERDIVKAETIGNHVVTVSDYIKKLFLLNFEIILALFWLFLIFMIFVVLGFIFLVVYWLWIYLARAIK